MYCVRLKPVISCAQNGMKMSTLVKHFERCGYSNLLRTNTPLLHKCQLSTAAEIISEPNVEGQDKIYPQKLQSIVSDISQLTLLEVSDLNELLKKTLKISDAPVMMAGTMAAAAPQEEEEVEVKQEKTAFTVKLVKFDAAKKVALIKEIKAQLSGMNLVQAKKFVESVPQNVKQDLPKDEAEKLKEALTAVGATVEIE